MSVKPGKKPKKKHLDSNHHRNSSAGIDLHVHSTASDGTVPPVDIITAACRVPLAAIAITDHDTLAGVRQVLDAQISDDIGFLTGIEMSITPPPSFSVTGSLHLLGYGFDVDAPGLNAALEKLRDSRNGRNPRIIEKLNALGMDISFEQVQKEAGESQLGRPHIAVCLVKKGYASSINNAFDRFLGTGRPAYVDRYRIAASEAISLIRTAGGIPVLAHPDLYGLSPKKLEEMIGSLTDAGMMGIEVYYPGHSSKVVNHLMALARKLDLLMTGGTDFHGDLKPDTRLGVGTGDFFVPVELYEKLLTRLSRMPADQP